MNTRKSAKHILLFFVLTLSVLFCSCTNTPPAETTDPGSHTNIDLEDLVFSYTELPFPETLSTADHLFCCYQSASQTLLSVCSDNGRQIGPTQKTDFLALCDMEGGMTSFPVETDAYITSALPYQGGVVYADYKELSDGSVEWSVTLKSGSAETVIDTGAALSYDRVPYLYYVQDTPYYLREDRDGFSVLQIKDQTPAVVYSKTGCSAVSIDVRGNGKQFCFPIQYSGEDFSRFLVFDEDGLLYEHTLGGKITSYAITDQYAVCGTGNEDTRQGSVEAVDLSTGQAKTFDQPYGALWGLTGSGNLCLCVGYDWQPYAINIATEQISVIPGPKSSTNRSTPIFFYPAGESRFFALSRQKTGYAFYLLTASAK